MRLSSSRIIVPAAEVSTENKPKLDRMQNKTQHSNLTALVGRRLTVGRNVVEVVKARGVGQIVCARTFD